MEYLKPYIAHAKPFLQPILSGTSAAVAGALLGPVPLIGISPASGAALAVVASLISSLAKRIYHANEYHIGRFGKPFFWAVTILTTGSALTFALHLLGSTQPLFAAYTFAKLCQFIGEAIEDKINDKFQYRYNRVEVIVV
jgi:hypothetical protein